MSQMKPLRIPIASGVPSSPPPPFHREENGPSTSASSASPSSGTSKLKIRSSTTPSPRCTALAISTGTSTMRGRSIVVPGVRREAVEGVDRVPHDPAPQIDTERRGVQVVRRRRGRLPVRPDRPALRRHGIGQRCSTYPRERGTEAFARLKHARSCSMRHASRVVGREESLLLHCHLVRGRVALLPLLDA